MVLRSLSSDNNLSTLASIQSKNFSAYNTKEFGGCQAPKFGDRNDQSR
jgi:hypothetical protein